MPLTVGVQVPDSDRELLTSWTRSPSLRAGLAQRARVVLLAGDGLGTNEIVRRVGLSPKSSKAAGLRGLDGDVLAV